MPWLGDTKSIRKSRVSVSELKSPGILPRGNWGIMTNFLFEMTFTSSSTSLLMLLEKIIGQPYPQPQLQPQLELEANGG